MKTLSLTYPNGVTQSYGYSSPATVAGDVTTYQTSGPVQNPATPPVDPPVTPPVDPPVVPSNVKMGAFGPPSKGIEFTLGPGQIGCFPMPADIPQGYVQVFQNVATPPSDTFTMWFSTTPGDINDPLTKQSFKSQWGGAPGTPCIKSYSYTGGPLYWSQIAGSPTVGYLEPKPGVTYYMNYVSTGASASQTITQMVQLNKT